MMKIAVLGALASILLSPALGWGQDRSWGSFDWLTASSVTRETYYLLNDGSGVIGHIERRRDDGLVDFAPCHGVVEAVSMTMLIEAKQKCRRIPGSVPTMATIVGKEGDQVEIVLNLEPRSGEDAGHKKITVRCAELSLALVAALKSSASFGMTYQQQGHIVRQFPSDRPEEKVTVDSDPTNCLSPGVSGDIIFSETNSVDLLVTAAPK